MITTVVFDLDDTLYDELDYCRSGFRAVARFLAKVAPIPCSDEVFASLWRHFSAGNRTRTFDAALDDLGLDTDEALITQLIEVYRTHRPSLKLPADSRQTLETLRKTHTLALLTDGYLPAQRLKVQALGIEDYFKAIVYTEQLGRAFWKPSPVGFERLAEELDVDPAQMVYVGDNEAKDFIGPNRLGMLTVQLRRAARLHTAGTHADSLASPQISIRDITELPNILVRY